MELAAVLYLAESNRKKGEYPRLKKTEEKLVFITETYYPIWLIPWNKATLLFDGFSLISHTFFCDVSPNIEIFNKDIQRNKKTTDSYIASLTRNIDYFKNFKGKEEIRIEGLVTIADLKEDLRNYLPLMKKAKKSFTNIVFLKPTMNTHEIHSGIKQLSELKIKIEKDIQKKHKDLETYIEKVKKEQSRSLETAQSQIKALIDQLTQEKTDRIQLGDLLIEAGMKVKGEDLMEALKRGAKSASNE